MTDPINLRADTTVRGYVQALLRRDLADEEGRLERIHAAEKAGHRIVDGGQTTQHEWEITDWRTKETIATGADGLDGYAAAATRLDPNGKWLHIDQLDSDYTRIEPPTGIPGSLADALEDWLGSAGTTDEDVAQFVGWSVDKVTRHREES